MKPTKNQFYCIDCGKRKMRFETEKKANTFIKFNANDVEQERGLKPERSYYCPACCSWHITSQKEIKYGKSRTEAILNLYKTFKEKIKTQKRQPANKTEEDRAKRENFLNETKSKREEISQQLKIIESNLVMVKTLNRPADINKCLEILSISRARIETIKSTLLELEHIYKTMLTKREIENLFMEKTIKMQELEEKLNLLSQELKNK